MVTLEDAASGTHGFDIERLRDVPDSPDVFFWAVPCIPDHVAVGLGLGGMQGPVQRAAFHAVPVGTPRSLVWTVVPVVIAVAVVVALAVVLAVLVALAVVLAVLVVPVVALVAVVPARGCCVPVGMATADSSSICTRRMPWSRQAERACSQVKGTSSTIR